MKKQAAVAEYVWSSINSFTNQIGHTRGWSRNLDRDTQNILYYDEQKHLPQKSPVHRPRVEQVHASQSHTNQSDSTNNFELPVVQSSPGIAQTGSPTGDRVQTESYMLPQSIMNTAQTKSILHYIWQTTPCSLKFPPLAEMGSHPAQPSPPLLSRAHAATQKNTRQAVESLLYREATKWPRSQGAIPERKP